MKWLLVVLFFSVPLVFSHLLVLLEIPVVLGGFGAYEGPKLAILSLLILLSIFWRSIFPSKQSFFEYQKGWLIASATMLGIFAIHVFLGDSISSEYFGIEPFYMGFFPFLLLGILAMLLAQSSKKEFHLSYLTSFVALFLVSLYAIIQKIGLDSIEYSINFGDSRVFSTIGNPNSLALYILLLLPSILFNPNSKWKWYIGMVLLGVIFFTGSISLFFIACILYAGAICYAAGAPKWWYVFCFLFLSITGIQWAMLTLGSSDDKYLSLLTRLTIWSESIGYIVQHPTTLLWGTPQQNLLEYLNENRSAELLKYIPNDFILFHLHNTWLDLIFQFGVLGLAGVMYGIRIWYKKLRIKKNPILITTLTITAIAGCFHHLELFHWIVLLLVLFASKFEIVSPKK